MAEEKRRQGMALLWIGGFVGVVSGTVYLVAWLNPQSNIDNDSWPWGGRQRM